MAFSSDTAPPTLADVTSSPTMSQSEPTQSAPQASGSPSSGAPADASTAPAAKLDKKKSIILGLVGVAFIVLIFWKVIPQIGSYSDALQSLESMTGLALVLIGVSVVVYLAVYGFPFMAAAPGLRYWRSQQVNQAAFAISNGVPAGGAVGLAVQFGMLTSFRITPTSATAAITAVGLWSTFVSLGFPILGIVAITAAGGSTPFSWVGPVGLLILVASVVIFVLIMRSPRIATGVGKLANALIRPLGKFIHALRDKDLVPAISKFRVDMYDLLKRRWLLITVAQIAVSFTQFLILYVALRGVEGWSTQGTSALAAFGAFATSQIMLMVPITPGGLGTTDALMIQLLVGMGTEKGAATAADLVWRATSYVPQIVVGVIALVAWYRKAGQAIAGAAGRVGGTAQTGTH